MSEAPGPRKNHVATWILSILLVVAIGAGGFWYWQYRQSVAKSPQAEQQRWKDELDAVAIAPKEEPVVTTVLDKNKLTNETLRSQAQNGDRIYIYAKNKRIILYRPAQQRVVNMLTIQTQGTSSASNTDNPKPSAN